MQINVTGHHVELTDGLNEAVTQKCKKIAKHFPDMASVNVILTVDKNTQTAEATTHFLGQDIVAKANADDLYAAIADMGAKLEKSLQKRK
ncbi:Ribosome hibernation protein YhbH [gamma proteobacterium IMCC2047]|nr:Ribosome hibernation protein YhbH [gamma proteobacterium IMCC2047]